MIVLRFLSSNFIFAGTSGYLATVTTPEEHNWIVQNFGFFQTAYFGASDNDTEGIVIFAQHFKYKKTHKLPFIRYVDMVT